MTIAEMNIACALSYIDALRQSGAQVRLPDGTRSELNAFIYDGAKDECLLNGYDAICYELFLPGIDEPLMIAILNDGRVDAGSEESVIRRLDS